MPEDYIEFEIEGLTNDAADAVCERSAGAAQQARPKCGTGPDLIVLVNLALTGLSTFAALLGPYLDAKAERSKNPVTIRMGGWTCTTTEELLRYCGEHSQAENAVA